MADGLPRKTSSLDEFSENSDTSKVRLCKRLHFWHASTHHHQAFENSLFLENAAVCQLEVSVSAYSHTPLVSAILSFDYGSRLKVLENYSKHRRTLCASSNGIIL